MNFSTPIAAVRGKWLWLGPTFIWLWACIGLSLITTLFLSSGFENLELYTLDIRFTARNKEQGDNRIVILLERWKDKRGRYADLIDQYSSVSAIGFDLIFKGPDPFDIRDDDFLVSSTEDGNEFRDRIYYAFGKGETTSVKGLGDSSWPLTGIPENRLYSLSGVSTPLTPLLETAPVGHVIRTPGERSVRRIPLLIEHQGHYYPSLSLLMFCGIANIEPEQIQVDLGKEVRIRPERGGTIKIPIDEKARILVNFIGDFDRENLEFEGFKTAFLPKDILSLGDSIRVFDEPERAILLVGHLGDKHPTPFSPLPEYPGVGVHANVLNSILQQNFIKSVDHYSANFNLILFFSLILICLIAVVFFGFQVPTVNLYFLDYSKHQCTFYFVSSLFCLMQAYVLISFVLFRYKARV